MAKLNLPKQRTAITNASLLKRFIAFLVDLLIIQLIVVSPFRKIVEKLVGGSLTSFSKINELVIDVSLSKTLTNVTIALGVLSLIYFMIFEYKLNQTPGKILFNIYTISEIGKLTIWQTLLRSVFIIPVFPLVLLWIIDPLFLLINKKGLRLTEQLSKTRVIERINY